MKSEGEGQVLRIYVGESDRWEGRPLYEAIVRAAHEQGLTGATALRGIEGFGASGRIHTVRVLHLSENLPVVVEVVDQAERIAAFMPTVDRMVGEGMVTLDTVNILVYRRPAQADATADDELQLEPSVDQEQTAAQATAAQVTSSHRIIEIARANAAASRRSFIDSIDLLLALLQEGEGIAGRVLADLRIDIRTVERCLREEVSRDARSGEFSIELEAKSLAAAHWLGHHEVGSEHLLLALCVIRPSAATDILMRLGVQPREICQDVLQILGFHDDWQRWLADHPDM